MRNHFIGDKRQNSCVVPARAKAVGVYNYAQSETMEDMMVFEAKIADDAMIENVEYLNQCSGGWCVGQKSTSQAGKQQ